VASGCGGGFSAATVGSGDWVSGFGTALAGLLNAGMTGKSFFESLWKMSGSLIAFGLLDPGLRNASRSYGSAASGFLSVTGSAGA
jgi:hypothetical protein